MNFGTGDFSEMILRRPNGDTVTIKLGGDVATQQMTVSRLFGRTVLTVTIQSDISYVRFDPSKKLTTGVQE